MHIWYTTENISTDLTLPAYALSPSFAPFGISDIGSYSYPTLVDIDDDGDLDMFIGESQGSIEYFQNISTDSSIPSFVLSFGSEPFGLVDVGNNSAPVFVDIDGDRDFDAFIGEINGNINFFENTTSDAAVPAFDNIAGSQNTAPITVDIDGDGDLDVFIGNFDGTLTYYENVSTATGDLILEKSASAAPFGISDVGYNASPSFADVDQDGDLDALIGNSGGQIYYFENISSDGSPIAFGVPIINPFNLIDVGFDAAPFFVDIDQDGDIDALVGEDGGNINYFENTSSDSSVPEYVLSSSFNPFGLGDIGSDSQPHLVDIDGDSDLDIFIGEFSGNLNYYENTSSESTLPVFTFRNANNPFGITDVGTSSTPAIADIDGDGFFEAIVGKSEGIVNFYESDISTELIIVDVSSIQQAEEVFCSDITTPFASVTLVDGSCDRNGNATYSASVTPANQGVTAIVTGTGSSDCSFDISVVTTEDAVPDNYSVNLVIEDPEGVRNSSGIPEVVNTGTTLVFNLGVVEIINLELPDANPLPADNIAEGETMEIKTNVSNTTDNTTYTWTVGGTSIPVLTGDGDSTPSNINVSLEGAGSLVVEASTRRILNGFTEVALDITNTSMEVSQNVDVQLVVTQFCGSDTVRTTLVAGDLECATDDVILGNMPIGTGFYEAKETLNSKSIIERGEGVVFRAGQQITLEVGFHAKQQSDFQAIIEDCTLAEHEIIDDRTEIVAMTEETLEVFPNPAHSRLTIQNGEGEMRIYDMLGNVVLSNVIRDAVFTLDVSHLSSGQYVLAIRKADGSLATKLFVTVK
ncbi:MAG: FG-GAP-like repeat-containing protein [Bacteroidota bacterium]